MRKERRRIKRERERSKRVGFILERERGQKTEKAKTEKRERMNPRRSKREGAGGESAN